MKKECCESACSRLGKVGGQAVIEGVMMKAGEKTVTTCRKADGTLVVTDGEFHSVRKKHKILNIPILRGIINFVEMMILSVKTLGISADALDLEGEEAKEKKKEKEGGTSLFTTVLMIVSTVLGLALSLVLFMFLPTAISDLIDDYVITLGVWRAVLEGVLKVAIFLAYLCLVTLMKDIRRTFMYHGAEHKSIACFESGEDLTPENAAKHRRFHPRCGTSFMFFMILLGIIAGLFIRIIAPGLEKAVYIAIRLAILPFIMGLGYEFILFAGKHENIVTRILSAPGLWVQRITTKEPTLDMLEVAITSLKCALRDDFPEFKEFYESRPWEKPDEGSETAGESNSTQSSGDAIESEEITSGERIDLEAAGAAKEQEPEKTSDESLANRDEVRKINDAETLLRKNELPQEPKAEIDPLSK